MLFLHQCPINGDLHGAILIFVPHTTPSPTTNNNNLTSVLQTHSTTGQEESTQASNHAETSEKGRIAQSHLANSFTPASIVDHQPMASSSAHSCPAPPQQTSSRSQTSPKFNPIPTSKSCNIDIDRFEKLLESHPDQPLVRYIIDGLRHGFDIGLQAPSPKHTPKI